MADEDLAARVTALEETVGLVPTGDATGAAGADAGGGSAEGAAGDDGSAELRAENEALKEKVAKLEYRVKFLMRSLMAAEAAAAPAGAGVRASDIDVGVSGVSVPPVDDEVVAWAVAEMKARLANAANARTSEGTWATDVVVYVRVCGS